MLKILGCKYKGERAISFITEKLYWSMGELSAAKIVTCLKYYNEREVK